MNSKELLYKKAKNYFRVFRIHYGKKAVHFA